jgi:hypothetical protein
MYLYLYVSNFSLYYASIGNRHRRSGVDMERVDTFGDDVEDDVEDGVEDDAEGGNSVLSNDYGSGNGNTVKNINIDEEFLYQFSDIDNDIDNDIDSYYSKDDCDDEYLELEEYEGISILYFFHNCIYLTFLCI